EIIAEVLSWLTRNSVHAACYVLRCIGYRSPEISDKLRTIFSNGGPNQRHAILALVVLRIPPADLTGLLPQVVPSLLEKWDRQQTLLAVALAQYGLSDTGLRKCILERVRRATHRDESMLIRLALWELTAFADHVPSDSGWQEVVWH